LMQPTRLIPSRKINLKLNKTRRTYSKDNKPPKLKMREKLQKLLSKMAMKLTDSRMNSDLRSQRRRLINGTIEEK